MTDEGPKSFVMGIGLVATFLFRDGSSPARRAAVASIANEYLAFAGPHLRWRSREEECVDLTRKTAPPIERMPWFQDGRGPFDYFYSSGQTPTDASPYEFAFLCFPSWEPVGISSLSMQLPLDQLNSDFIIRFQRFASLLNADQAYAGVGIQQRPSGSASSFGYLAYALALRYPGLEFFSPLHTWEVLHLKNAMRSINWLTAIGDRYLEQLGGWETASRGFDPRIAIYKYDGGVIFQAGAKPDLGDAGPPELYRQVARALKPVRFSGDQPGFFRPSEKSPTFDAANTAHWLARFD